LNRDACRATNIDDMMAKSVVGGRVPAMRRCSALNRREEQCLHDV
jgi:hypothetical protein